MTPWTFVRERLNAIADQVLKTHDLVHSLGTTLAMLERARRKEPDPFVCVLAEADGPHGRTTLGGAARAKENGTVIELLAQVPMKAIRLTVFADLERVSIHGIFVGVDLATAALGDCPVVFFEEWPVGVKVRVQCTRRKESA